MGRFYRPSSAMPLDYMYQANVPLMERVVEANDAFIDQSLGTVGKVEELSNYNHLIEDAEDAKLIQQQYQTKVDELAKAIQKDPANWRKQLDPIRNLTRDISTNYKSGPISKQIYNYNKRKEYFDAVDKQVELYHTSGGTKGVDPTRATAYKTHWDSGFSKTGYDPTTGSYNVYKGGSVMDNIDIKKILSDGLDKLKADKNVEYHSNPTGNDWYIRKDTNERVEITPERVLQIASDNMNNPQLMNYLQQDSRVGLLKGVYGDDGRFIQPYSYSTVGLAPEEEAQIASLQTSVDAIKNPGQKKQAQQQLNATIDAMKQRQKLDWNNESYLAPILRGLVNQYSYKENTVGDTLTNNSKGATIFREGQANNRNAAAIASREKISREVQNRMDARQTAKFLHDEKKWQWDLDHPKPSSKSGTSGTKVGGKKEETVTETTASTLPIKSLNDWVIYDKNGKQVPVLSASGIAAKLDQDKNELSNIDAAIKFIDSDKNKTLEQKQTEKAQLNKRRLLVQSDIDNTRKWWANADKAALEGLPTALGKDGVPLTTEEKTLYNKYAGSDNPNFLAYDKKTSELRNIIKEENAKIGQQGSRIDEETAKKLAAVQGTGVDASNAKNRIMAEATATRQTRLRKAQEDLKNLEKEFSTYNQAKNKVVKYRDNFLTKLRADYIDNKAINLGTKDAKEVSDLVLGNARGVQLFDTNGEVFAGKGQIDGYSMDFNTTDGKSLSDYIVNNNVKMNVMRIGNSPTLGDGNGVAEVKFNDPKGNIPPQTFYLTLTPQLRKDLASKFKAHKNADVSGVANDMLDDVANNIRRQVMDNNPSVNRTMGFDLKNDGTKTIFVNNINGEQVPLEVTRMNDGGSNHLMVSVIDQTTGKRVPLPREDDKTLKNNFYTDIEDFIANYKLSLQKKPKKIVHGQIN